MRVGIKDMAYATLVSYRKILKRVWRPKLEGREFTSVVYSELVEIAASHCWKSKETHNNNISPLKRAFAFGYKDHPELRNPAEGLDCLRKKKQDLPKVDPFSSDCIPSTGHPRYGRHLTERQLRTASNPCPQRG